MLEQAIKRQKALGFPNFAEYVRYCIQKEINTTNKGNQNEDTRP